MAFKCFVLRVGQFALYFGGASRLGVPLCSGNGKNGTSLIEQMVLYFLALRIL